MELVQLACLKASYYIYRADLNIEDVSVNLTRY